MLAPMAPHFASELWSGFQCAPNRLSNNEEYDFSKTVLEQPWPDVDQEYSLDLLCQINGNDYAVIKIPRKQLERMEHDTAIKLALEQQKVQEELENRSVVNIKFDIYSGYQGVVNITARKTEKVASNC